MKSPVTSRGRATLFHTIYFMEETNNYSLLYRLGRRLFSLKVEDARLMLAVKLTRLLGAVICLFVGFMLFLCLLGFIAAAIGHQLCEAMSPVWAYLIIAAFYLVLLVVIVLAKKYLIINPIARFMSRLIVEHPEK